LGLLVFVCDFVCRFVFFVDERCVGRKRKKEMLGERLWVREREKMEVKREGRGFEK